jgi:putative Mg2+ transporter-C (MgtC) family protein
MGIAEGAYLLVLASTAIVLGSLLLLTKLEFVIDRVNQLHTYKIVSPFKEELFKEYEALFSECDLTYKVVKRTKTGNNIVGIWHVQGSQENHDRFTKSLLHHPEIIEFEF